MCTDVGCVCVAGTLSGATSVRRTRCNRFDMKAGRMRSRAHIDPSSATRFPRDLSPPPRLTSRSRRSRYPLCAAYSLVVCMSLLTFLKSSLRMPIFLFKKFVNFFYGRLTKQRLSLCAGTILLSPLIADGAHLEYSLVKFDGFRMKKVIMSLPV